MRLIIWVGMLFVLVAVSVATRTAAVYYAAAALFVAGLFAPRLTGWRR